MCRLPKNPDRESASQKGIVITDHNYQNILDLATQLVLLKDGKLHHLSSAEELVGKGYLKSEMR